MKSIDILSKDHEDVLKLLERFYESVEQIEDGKGCDRKNVEEILRFFNSDFWLHFDKEEQTIFPELSKFISGSSEPAGPVVAMLDEHRTLRESNEKMQIAYKNFDKDTKKFASEARNFIGLLRQHIKMEEEMLFPMTLRSLDHCLDDKWLEEFAAIDNKAT